MAEGLSELTLESLQSSDGINQINQMLRTLYDNISGDTESVRVFNGYGSPEGVVAAGIGSLYLRLDGGSGTSVYFKETGTDNTGWVDNGTSGLSLPLSVANGGTGANLSLGTSGNYLGFTSTGVIGEITPPAVSVSSNVLFQYSAAVEQSGIAVVGEITTEDFVDTTTNGKYRFMAVDSESLTTVWTTKFKKIAGISTVTIYAQLWEESTNPATIKVIVGSANNSFTDAGSQNTPAWITFTVDVSTLVNGTVYDVAVQLNSENPDSAVYMGTLIAFGS